MKRVFFIILSVLILGMLSGCDEEIEELAEEMEKVTEDIEEDVQGSEEYVEISDSAMTNINDTASVADDSNADASEADGEESYAEIETTGDKVEDVQTTDDITGFESGYSDIVPGSDSQTVDVADDSQLPSTDEFTLDIDGTYTTAEDVSLYIYLYDDLPDNFMTKNEARELGWSGGGLEDYAPGMCIGGDRFGNYEGLLPKEKGRVYTECDINTLGEDSRGAERIVFSNDGLIFYTDDHYDSFILLYDEDGKAA